MTGRRFRVDSAATLARRGAVTAVVAAAAILWTGSVATAAAPAGNAKPAPTEPPLTLENARPAVVPPRPNLKTQRSPSAPPPLFTPDMLDVPDPAKVDLRAPLPTPTATPGLPPVPPRDKRPPSPPTTVAIPTPAPAPAAKAPAATPPVAAPAAAPAVALPARPWRVEFTAGSSSLSQQAMPLISALADAMTATPGRRLKLLAYAPGDTDHQREARQLSLARALAIREKLNGLGIRATRVDLHPLGATIPNGETATPDRVELEWATE